MIAAVACEVLRMVSWRRWWFVAVPAVCVAVVIGEEVAGRASTYGFTVNAWDLPLEILGNSAIVAYVLIPLATLLGGQVLTRDRADGYAALTFTRIENFARWWTSKILAVAVVLLAATGSYLVITVLVGWATTGSLGWEVSEYGAASRDPFGTAAEAARYFAPPPWPGAGALIGTTIMAGYTATAIWCLLVLCCAPAARWPKAWVPLASVGVVVAIFSQVRPTTILHPLVHLIWDYHTFSSTNVAVTWWASAMVLAAEVVVACVGGWWLGRRTDILKGVIAQ